MTHTSNFKLDNTSNYSWPFFVDNPHNCAFIDDLFSSQECDTIVETYKNNLSDATIVNEKNISEINNEYRDSSVCFIQPQDINQWMYRRITDAVVSLNDDFFNFDITGFNEGLQFTEYKAPGQFYKPHIDVSFSGVIRKLSISIQLSDPIDYDGGDLSLITSEEPMVVSKKRGTIIMFPSYYLHEVSPVTRGTRYSLVGWITGPKFK